MNRLNIGDEVTRITPLMDYYNKPHYQIGNIIHRFEDQRSVRVLWKANPFNKEPLHEEVIEEKQLRLTNKSYGKKTRRSNHKKRTSMKRKGVCKKHKSKSH